MTEFKGSGAFKRAEQLKRWEESETNDQSLVPKKASRITFSLDCVFLAACAAGDKDEVLRLVQDGADVNTPSVDGLTALHQACIDNKPEMVEFLIRLGADVNLSDNEGWTPLHATASCGFLSIASCLLNHGASLTKINNESELPVDTAANGPMKNFLMDEIKKKGIDCDYARKGEERELTENAKIWRQKSSYLAEQVDNRTGATPLHVAAAKGYIEAMHILIVDCKVNIDPVDTDGWTPLHAAAHWGQQEAAELLVRFCADMDIKNFVGQTCFDVATEDMVKYLEGLKKQKDEAQSRKTKRPSVSEDHLSKVPKVDSNMDNGNNKKPIDQKNSLDVAEEKPPKVSPVDPPQQSDEPSWRHSLRQKVLSNQSTNNADKESTGSDSDVILRSPISEADIATQNVKAKKENSAPGVSQLRSLTTDNVSERNDTANKMVSSEVQTSKLFPGNIFKNFFKSFVPPVRDEESETQRKAHAKRVRETRRSTQGVTLDEIKSAEQLVKKKNNTKPLPNTKVDITRKDEEVVNKPKEPTSTDVKPHIRIEETSASEASEVSQDEQNNHTVETTITIALPRTSSLSKDEDLEARGATQAAQNVIQRRRRPKRRSTGLVNVSPDDITPDQTNDGADSGTESVDQTETDIKLNQRKEDESNLKALRESNPEEESRKSVQVREEIIYKELDYKVLFEIQTREVAQLREYVLMRDQDLANARDEINQYMEMISSLTENEKRAKRERRATERKMSEMEEELKYLNQLQAENKRLKNENGALVRVISKLSK